MLLAQSGRRFALVVFPLVIVVFVWHALAAPSHVEGGLTGRIVVAGYGPELPLLQDLGKAFEKSHPGSAIDFEWDRNVKAADLVKTGTADIAVTDRPLEGLRSVQIAWDGIAVIVNFANPIRELTSRQLQAVFTGQINRWSQLDGADTKIEMLDRPPEDNIKAGFEASLGITDRMPSSPPVVRTDQRALRAVSGKSSAVTYLSLSAALKAQEDGIPIQVLTIDAVEPGQPTVKDGTYPLRRPVYLLSQEKPSPLAEAFLAFAQSAEAELLVKSVFVPTGTPAVGQSKHLGRLQPPSPPPTDTDS